MIDYAAVVSQGGVVLWNRLFREGFDDDDDDGGHVRTLLNKLVETVILEERGGDQYATIDGFNFRWTVIHSLDVTMYITYRGIQNAQSINELLETCSELFVKKVEEHHGVGRKYDWASTPLKFGFDMEFDTALYSSNMDPAKAQPSPEAAAPATRNQNKTESTKKHEKTKRQWHIKETVSKQEMDELDFSSDKGKEPVPISGPVEMPEVAASPPVTAEAETKGVFKNVKDSIASFFGIGRDQNLRKDSKKSSAKDSHGLLDSFSKVVSKYAGNMVLTEEAIQEPLKELKMRLNSKNVASDISTLICESVSAGLVGKKTASLTSVAATVHKAVEDSVRRILTPKEPINLIQNVHEANASGDIYSVLFLGVNGVGKSTSLAKVTYLLKCNGFKVLLIACDTFRSGAVEQLKIHADRLGVELFERGYGKDPSAICKEGMKYAKANGFNAVLIDTAGRMQDNEPLMSALAKLIQVNNPNLLLFVGEALVGNDAVDQLKKFNQAIRKISETHAELQHRKIDGIVLTKFDTVDDKVGAALSMCYITGQPIVFVGTGQTYTNLGKLEIDDVVDALTK